MPVDFLALAGPAPADLEAALSAAGRVVPFQAEPPRRFEFSWGVLLVWVRPPTLGEPVLTKDGAVSLLTGPGWRAEDGELLQPEELHSDPERLRRARAEYEGEWSALRAGPEGVDALSASCGSTHVYYAERGRLSVIGSRARLIWALQAAFGERPAVDEESAGWMLGLRYPARTNRSAVRGVRLLRAHERWRWRVESGASVDDVGYHDFLQRSGQLSFDELFERLLAPIRRLPFENAELALTGGKDSRAVLALVRAAGRLDDVGQLVTIGPPAHADVIVARRLADHIGRTHTRRDWNRPSIFERLQDHLLFTEGLLNVWDLKEPVDVGTVRFEGLMGGAYRRRLQGAFTSGRALARHMLAWRDPMRVLRPRFARHLEAELVAWFEDATKSCPPRLVADLFHLENRLPRWMGQARLAAASTGIELNPLFHRDLLARHMRMSQEERARDLVHFELLRKLAPDLLPLPLARARWHPSQRNETSHEQVEHAEPIVGASWQLPALQNDWPRVRELILASRDVLNAVVDPDRVPLLLGAASQRFGLNDPAETSLRFRPFARLRARFGDRHLLMQTFAFFTVAAFAHLAEEGRLDAPLGGPSVFDRPTS